MSTLNGNDYDSASFQGQAYASEDTGLVPALDDAVAHFRGIYRAYSATSLTIGNGTKSLMVDKDRPLFVGFWVRIESEADSANYMEGTVTSYDADTGALVVSVAVGDTGGAGTLSAWNVLSMGKRGATGNAATSATETNQGVVELASRAEVAARADALRVVVPAYLDLRDRSARTSNTILGVADRGHFIDITSGTFTQTITAAATLGGGWWCRLRNSGTGDITIDPNGSETIDGLTSFIMYPGECRDIFCDGAGFFSVVVSPFRKVFASGATWTKPPGYLAFDVDALAAGGGGGGGRRGAAGSNRYGGGGGAGGSRRRKRFAYADVGSTETVTIGAGGTAGAAAASNNTQGGNGGAGGNTSFGSLLVVYGGGGGLAAQASGHGAGGGGGSDLSAGSGATPGTSMGGSDTTYRGGTGGAEGVNGVASIWGGGGGGGSGINTPGGGSGGGTLEAGAGGGAGGSWSSSDSTSAGFAGGGQAATAGGGGAAGAVNAAGGAGAKYQGGGGAGADSAGRGLAGGAGGIGAGGGGGNGMTNDATGTNPGGVGGNGELIVYGVI